MLIYARNVEDLSSSIKQVVKSLIQKEEGDDLLLKSEVNIFDKS